MKKILTASLVTFLLAHFSIVDGQTMYNRSFMPKYGFGFKAGVNYATQYTPENEGAFESMRIFGFNAGGYYHYFFNRILGVQVEISGSGKGSHWKENFYAQDEKKDLLTYIDVPLLVRYQPHPRFNAHIGPQISILARAMQYDYDTRIKADVSDFYKMVDAGIVAGVEANLKNHVNLTLRYCHSLVSAYKTGGYNFDSYNSYLQLTAGYRIEKKMQLQSKTRSSIRRRR